MIRKVSFAALAVLGCTSMSAAADTRIRSLPYDPDHIVQILGKAGIQSTIEFAPDERIENIAVGDSNAWQITPNHRASLVFVKPLAPRTRTNMTVVTDRRTYMFDLVAGDKWTTPVYALKFTYRNEKPPEAEAKPGQSAPQLAVAAAPPSTTMVADKLHFDWRSKGYGKLVPSRVFDDGAAVYLSWNRDVPLPAILTVTEDRKEGPLSYRMSGEYIVVSPIPQNMVLRYGNRMAVLWTSRRIVPAPAAPAATPPSDFAQRVAATQVTPSAPPPSQGRAVRLANLTALYSDKLTDGR
ncbi:TrbG/VirB9 family P-type conjugative transfer protein [Sphingomonas sp.]|uniref:TrbG/VirB9 family P-type conjugative transfer protein n=1 Tax=Sphingomonas sp. TaxID=28214 RepID=UPI0038A6FBB9